MNAYNMSVGQLNEVYGSVVMGAGAIPLDLCNLGELEVLRLEYNDIVGKCEISGR